MSRYGVSNYGVSYYGSDNPINFDATPFTAKPYNYGSIVLNWADPKGSWSQLVIVRNPYGFPINAYDGTTVLTVNNGADPITYVDSGLVQGQFYYYSIFVYNLTQYTWTNAANAISISVKNYNNTDDLYAYLPEIYKIAQPYVATSDWDNPTLYSFLSNFGFQLDYVHTLTDLLEQKYNVETVSGVLVPTMMNQFGQTYEPAIGLQQNRIILRDAVTLTRQKGSLQGLLAFVKDFTGWGVPDPIPNATFTYNSSSGQYVLTIPTGSVSYTYASGGTSGTNTVVITVPSGTTITTGSAIIGAGIQPNTTITNVAVTTTTTRTLTLSSYLFATASGIYTVIPVAPNPSVAGMQVGSNLMLDYNDSSFEESSGHWVSTDGTADVDQVDTLSITSFSLTSNVATLVIGSHQFDVGNYVTISGLSSPLFNTSTPVQLTAVNQSSSISFALTSSDVASTSGYNLATSAYGTVTPYPTPWSEPSAPTLFPNKTSGVMSLLNTSTSAQTVTAYCGDDVPITNGIPVVPGTTYCFSIFAAKGQAGTARTITSSIKWYNRFGVYISTSNGTGVSDNTVTFSSSYRPYVSATAPSTAYYACPGVSIASFAGSASNEHHYFDAAQFEVGSTPSSFEEARQIKLTLRANRINELTNPNFASVTAPWTTTGSATASIDATLPEPTTATYTVTTTQITSNVATVTVSTPHTLQVGSSVYLSNITGTGVTSANYNGARTITAITLYSFSYAVTATDQTAKTTTGSAWQTGHALKLTGSGTTPVVVKSWDGVTNSQLLNIYYPNTSYTFSAYVRTAATTETISLKINWYNSSYSLISSTTGTSVSATSAGWTRAYVTGTAPATAAYASAEIDWSNVVSGDVVYVDRALFENFGQVLTYFDGNGGPGDITDFVWEGGTANAARSHYYKNKFAVQTRLFGATLNAELPMGSTAAVYIAQPQT